MATPQTTAELDSVALETGLLSTWQNEKLFEATVDNIVKYSWHKQTGAIADSVQMAKYFREKAKQRILNAGSRTVHGDFLACSRFNLDERLGEISVPVLVIASDCDRMVPLHVSQKMAEKIPNAQFVTLEGCGHFQHIEQTNRVATELSNFLVTVGSTSNQVIV